MKDTTGMILFSYLTDFSYFPLINTFQKLLDTTDKKMDHCKEGVDGFSCFQLFYFLTRIIPKTRKHD